MVDETRWRLGKLERKDPATGVWVIHHAQYFQDHQNEIITMFEETDKQNRREERRLKHPKNAQEFLEQIRKDSPDIPNINVSEVFLTEVNDSLRENRAEIIFKGKDTKKYVAGCWGTHGSFDEPPDFDCWVEPLHEAVTRLERRRETGILSHTDKTQLNKLKKYV